MSNYALEVWAHFVRWMLHLRRQPVFMIFAFIQPFFWLLLFSQGLERTMAAASGMSPGLGDYTAFMTPTVLVMTVFNNSLSGGIPVLFDREFGTLNRILVAPISRSSILVGRFLAVSVISLMQVLIIIGCSTLMGVKVVTGLLGILAIIGLALLFGFGITILSLTLAFIFRSHVEFFAILGFVGLPLVFVSNAFVRLDALPTWLAIAARFNPMTYCIAATRELVQVGWDVQLLVTMIGALIVFDVLMMLVGTAVIRRKIS